MNTILKSKKLTPTEKIISLAIMEEYRDKKVDKNLCKIDDYLKIEGNGVTKMLGTPARRNVYDKLVAEGLIDKEGKFTVEKEMTPEEKALEKSVEYVLDYVSNSRKVRGYSSRSLTGEAHKKAIRARLREGATIDECIAVVNFRFESDWHKKNFEYLVPTTLFRRKNFHNVLANIDDVHEWASKEIVEYGIKSPEDDSDELIGVM